MKRPDSGSPNRRFLRPIPADRAILFDAPDAILPRDNTMLGVPSLGGRAGKWYRQAILPWAGLVHENIATVYEVVDHPTGVYEIRQQITGVRLQKYLDEGGQLGPREVRHVLERLVSGLEHAHNQGVVHGALSPDLVELSARGLVRLHRLSPAVINAWAGQRIPAARMLPYRSPEQVRGEVPTPLSDVFSLAVVAYQLISGKLPFSSLDPDTLDQEILRSEPPPLALRCGFPITLPQALRGALAREPRDRYRTPGEFLRALFAEAPLRSRDRARARDQHLAGLLWMQIARPQPALECWLETRWLCPGLARVESNVGVALAALGRWSEAEQLFQAANELDPGDDLLRMHLGWARWKQGKGEAPIDHLFADPDDALDVPLDGEFEPRLLEVESAVFFQPVGPSWPKGRGGPGRARL